MKKTFKIISIILVVMILNAVLLANAVQAVEGEQIKIYTKGYFKRIIKNNGIVIKTANAVYQQNGKEYPVYCLNRELHGVGDYIESYDVTNQGKILDLGLWRVIINGYPYKTIEELGAENEGEAYMATKQAIYCYLYNTGTENYTGVGVAGNRVINIMNTILENARNSTESFENPGIDVIEDKDWQIDNCQTYIYKQYEVKSDTKITEFIINLENQPSGTKVTNLKNQEKSEFNSSEKFKILIPISSLEESGEFKIKIQTQMETKPIFFGKSPSDDLQDCALTGSAYECINTELIQNYESNKTKITIQKEDAETGKALQGARFEISDKDKNLIKIEETNEIGEINLEQVLPGIYYIKEVEAPNGYEINEEVQMIEIKMNETQILKIKNNKIIIKEEPTQTQETTVIEVPKLPVTGM